MNLLITTGLSGAGKTHALKFLEDIGYFCADNIPPALIMKFAELFFVNQPQLTNVALGVDIRGGKMFDDMSSTLDALEQSGYDYKILFLDASDATLVNRFKETRRSHPLSKTEPVANSIKKEREILADLRSHADYIIDTSDMLTRQLNERIKEIFLHNKEFDNLSITTLSFGYKYGLPQEADLVFDVRFIPNPFYNPKMRDKTGEDEIVFDYVTEQEETQAFTEKLTDMLNFLLPNYIKEGKNSLVVAIGCTGGKHRSVSIARVINDNLNRMGYFSIISHRDINRA